MKDLEDKARQYALKLLSYRGRSEKELAARLTKKGFSGTATSSAIRCLKNAGLVNDIQLAEALVREASTIKLLGRAGTRNYMLNKGISRDIVDAAISHSDDAEIDSAMRLANKKLKTSKDHPFDIVRRRLYNLLSRRGYTSETIATVLKNINSKKREE